MSIPQSLQRGLKAPVIVSPMFLASGPDLVVETCRSGLIGTFPSLNQRTTQGYEDWLAEISGRLDGQDAAAFGVNLIVHRTNSRLEADLAATVKHKVPLVITSLGAVREVVDAVHSYGGLVFHDVISIRHAEKAAEAGVDGIIAVCAGAGGHAGLLSPFALVPEIRAMFGGTVILSGAMSTGAHVAAARLIGADFAYLGTRFLATPEAAVDPEHKRMIVDAHAADILYTPAISGVNANFLIPSLLRKGLDPANLQGHAKLDMNSEAKVWKDVWSAGQGVGSVHDIVPAAQLCGRLIAEYDAARAGLAAE